MISFSLFYFITFFGITICLSFIASFQAPDFDPDIYDLQEPEELDIDDLEWKNWLSKLMKDGKYDVSFNLRKCSTRICK